MEDSMHIKNYYSILNVPKDATADEIKRAFRDKAKKYHPDACNLPNAHEKFVEIGEAYGILNNIDSRRDYDSLLDEMSGNKHTYNDFRNSQMKATAQAEYYASMDIEDLITGVLGFAYELGRAILVGERDKPKISFRDYIKMGFYGVLLTIAIILSFTGIGTIPGVAISIWIISLMIKNGKLIGVVPLIISTIIADIIVLIVIMCILASIF